MDVIRMVGCTTMEAGVTVKEKGSENISPMASHSCLKGDASVHETLMGLGFRLQEGKRKL